MTGLDGLNPSPGALVVGLVQAAVPTIARTGDLQVQADRLADLLRRAKRGMPTLDLVVFPEYSLNGLDPETFLDDALLVDRDGPEVTALRAACAEVGVWGCFSLMERNPVGHPGTPGSSSTTRARTGSTTASCTPGSRWSPGNG